MQNRVARPVISTSIRTLLEALGRALDRFEGSHEANRRSGHAATVAKVEACGGAQCDGYGWINGATGGYQWARRCPDCAPEVRRSPFKDS